MDNFYLCNPDDNKSCGACCGLYNFKDHSEEFINKLLIDRRREFNNFGNNLSDYKKIREEKEKDYILSKTIYTCPFLSFIDNNTKKVGCLIHPKVIDKDLRDVSFYGSKVCSEHKCTAYIYYTPVEIKAVTKFTHTWYVYGLVLHDIDFVRSFFNLIEDGISRKLKIKDLHYKQTRKLWEEYFLLKKNWPYMNKKSNILDKYEFDNKLFKIRELNTFGLLEKNSNIYKILRALESNFNNQRDFTNGASIISNIINKLIEIYLNIDNI